MNVHDIPENMTNEPEGDRLERSRGLGTWDHSASGEVSLARKTARLGALIHRYYTLEARAKGAAGDPLRGQGRVLALLRAKPKTSQRELSYLLDMRQQSLSELLAKLEQKGYVTREKSSEDARVTIVSLTDAGAAAAPDPNEMQDGADAFDCLSEEELAQFERIVNKLGASIEVKLIDLGDDPRRGPRPGGRGPHGPHGPCGPHHPRGPRGPEGPDDPGDLMGPSDPTGEDARGHRRLGGRGGRGPARRGGTGSPLGPDAPKGAHEPRDPEDRRPRGRVFEIFGLTEAHPSEGGPARGHGAQGGGGGRPRLPRDARARRQIWLAGADFS